MVGGVMTKNVSMTDEAYHVLRRERKTNESLTDTILRLTQMTGKLSDCFGGWKISKEEETTIMKDLSEGWKRTTSRLRNEMS